MQTIREYRGTNPHTLEANMRRQMAKVHRQMCARPKGSPEWLALDHRYRALSRKEEAAKLAVATGMSITEALQHCEMQRLLNRKAA
jgi:hypothetical protein